MKKLALFAFLLSFIAGASAMEPNKPRAPKRPAETVWHNAAKPEPKKQAVALNHALSDAILKGNQERAKEALQNGANPNLPLAGCIHLHDALARGNLKIVELLLQYNADPNITGNYTTPFRVILNNFITEEKKHEAFQLLLDYGANPSVSVNRINPALLNASNNYHLNKLLCENGLPLTFNSFDGLYQRDHQQLKLFLKHGATINEFEDPNIPNDRANRIFLHIAKALYYAQKSKEFFLAALALPRDNEMQGIDPRLRKITLARLQPHVLPFYFAAGFGAEDDVKKLSKDCDQETLNTALMWAAGRGKLGNVHALLAQGAQPKKALKVIVPILMQKNTIVNSVDDEMLNILSGGIVPTIPMQKNNIADSINEVAIFHALAEKYQQPEIPLGSKKLPLLAKLMARTMKLNNIELAQQFLPYQPDLKPSLQYLDKALCRPLAPQERAKTMQIRDMLIKKSPLKEQMLRRGNFSQWLQANQIALPQEMAQEVAHRNWRDSLIARAENYK